MDDLVLEGFIRGYTQAHGISSLPPDVAFLEFVTSSLLRKLHQADISGMEDDILVDGRGDGGIDAIAIIVNGRLVSSEEDLEFMFKSHGRLDVELIFVQAKRSPRFSARHIGSFLFGVEQYFKAVMHPDRQNTFRQEIIQKIDLTRELYYTQSIKMRNNPRCFLYYVTTGQWSDSHDPKVRLDDGEIRLKELNLFSDVSCLPIDSSFLKDTYRALERSVVKEVEFIRTAAFPRIDRVGEAYIGLLPGDEFLELVTTDNGDLNRELFFDNVRDFQGHNPVNREIEVTLSDSTLRNSFPLLNNGITIIAGSIKRTADTFQIHDFQIVNGCQTTHILFQNREVVGPDIYIPIKLVATDDSHVVNQVIKATNRQTAVLPEALESLSAFHRELEDLYSTKEAGYSLSERIHYERRSKQYVLDNVPPRNIVSLTAQIKSFIGMFLNEPHSHPRYYGELLKAYEGRIFASDHLPAPYYASGCAQLIVEQWLNEREDWRRVRPYRYQLLMLLRMAIGGSPMPRLNSRRITDYSFNIVNALKDTSQGSHEFEKAISLLTSSLDSFRGRRLTGSTNMGRNPPHRLRAFTEHLRRQIAPGYVSPSERSTPRAPTIGESWEQGQVKYFDDVRGYGFIRRDDGQDIFIHVSEMTEVPYHLRVGGVEVEYKVSENPRSPGKLMARDVRLVPIQQARFGR